MMRIKSSKLFGIVILVTFISLLVTGCGKSGSRFANIAPQIQITSYEGFDPANPYTDSTEVTLFQQKIFWHAVDTDGVISGYAFRILDENGHPISTPGNKYIDVDGTYTPDNVKALYPENGWVLHYKPGADQSVPLDSTGNKSIWTEQKYATVNFLAATSMGIADTTISRFEVICLDNRGEVCQTVAFRRFRSYSTQPTCFLTTTKGNPGGEQVGTGIRLSFSLDDDDPFIQPTPWYYQFQLQKCDANTDAVLSTLPASGWYDTQNAEKLNQYLLTKHTTPALSDDYNDAGVKQTYTKIVGRVIDLAGIVSDTTSIKFAVKEGFHPKTLVYTKRVFGLGNNHYIDYNDETTPEVLPYTIVDNEQRFATRLFKDQDTTYTAVKSANLKLWLRWGWHGEYGTPLASGGTNITDNPYDKKVDILLDEDSDKNYFSEITHFDLRLDGEPYNYPPLATSVVTGNDGKRWLRVPVNSALGQTIVLTNQRVGLHTFEVRAVDLQGEPDTTPVSFKFKIVDPIPAADKSGILVIDDDVDNSTFAPDAVVDAKYDAMLSGTGQTVTHMDRAALVNTDDNLRKIALSDIQQYKFIIYHSDYTTNSANIQLEHDALSLYLKQGGNLLICGGSNISGSVSAVVLNRQNFFEAYFGLEFINGVAVSVTNNFISKTFFNEAVSQVSTYNSVPLAFDMDVNNPDPAPYYQGGSILLDDPNEASFVPLVNTRKGLGPLTYFTSITSGSAMFEYGCKPVSSTAPANLYLPPQADFDNLNGRVVGVRKITTNNKCYILGFPLSYMKAAEAKQLMTTIVSEVMVN
jgi:hypothetical protein